MKTKLVSVVLLLAVTISVKSQVTIGSNSAPLKGALLDLKEVNAPAGTGGVTATSGGLVLPRVSLADQLDLAPIVIDASDEEKKDHTGLVVYNVAEGEDLHKGMYQWDGEKWGLLQVVSKTEGTVVKKLLYNGTRPDNDKYVVIGPFKFMIGRITGVNSGNPTPFFGRAVPLTTSPITYTYHIGQFWDSNGGSMETLAGTSYDNASRTIPVDNTGWYQLASAMSNIERNELWLADPETEKIYNVQFMILGQGSINTYGVLATEY